MPLIGVTQIIPKTEFPVKSNYSNNSNCYNYKFCLDSFVIEADYIKSDSLFLVRTINVVLNKGNVVKAVGSDYVSKDIRTSIFLEYSGHKISLYSFAKKPFSQSLEDTFLLFEDNKYILERVVSNKNVFFYSENPSSLNEKFILSDKIKDEKYNLFTIQNQDKKELFLESYRTRKKIKDTLFVSSIFFQKDKLLKAKLDYSFCNVCNSCDDDTIISFDDNYICKKDSNDLEKYVYKLIKQVHNFKDTSFVEIKKSYFNKKNKSTTSVSHYEEFGKKINVGEPTFYYTTFFDNVNRVKEMITYELVNDKNKTFLREYGKTTYNYDKDELIEKSIKKKINELQLLKYFDQLTFSVDKL